MKSVAQILKAKPSRPVDTIDPSETVYQAIRVMAERGVGALVVMEGGRIAGIITERDYARKIVLMGRHSKDTPVRDAMSAPVMYVRPDQTNEECMALMTERRVRHLPVVDQDRLVGMVSIGDLIKDVISEQRFIIEQLQHYIMGGRA